VHFVPLAAVFAASAAWLPDPTAVAEFVGGNSALNEGALDQAEARFRAAMVDDPSCGACRVGLGVALYRMNRLDEAVAELEATSRAWPAEGSVWSMLATTHFARQDFPAARAAAEAGVRADPGSPDAMFSLQMVAIRQGDLPRARAALEGARATLPPAEFACLMGKQEAEEGKPAEAASRLDLCETASDPQYRFLLLEAIAAANSNLGELAALGAAYEATETLTVNQAFDRYNNRDFAGAEALLDTVLATTPAHVSARMVRARCRYERGALGLARVDLELVIGGGSWVTVEGSGSLTGVLRPEDEALVRDLIDEAGGLLARIQAEQGELAAAKATTLEQTMSTTITTRILDAVQGDAATIRSLAAAIATGDNDGVRSLLAARGVAITADELDQVVFSASGASACTSTCTMTSATSC
jgi:tetratricopeptide (TPR) repeat protein